MTSEYCNVYKMNAHVYTCTGTKEELNGILKLFGEGSWKPSFLADTMDSDTVTTTAEPSIGSAAIPNIHVAILEPLLEETASRVQKCTRGNFLS